MRARAAWPFVSVRGVVRCRLAAPGRRTRIRRLRRSRFVRAPSPPKAATTRFPRGRVRSRPNQEEPQIADRKTCERPRFARAARLALCAERRLLPPLRRPPSAQIAVSSAPALEAATGSSEVATSPGVERRMVAAAKSPSWPRAGLCRAGARGAPSTPLSTLYPARAQHRPSRNPPGRRRPLPCSIWEAARAGNLVSLDGARDRRRLTRDARALPWRADTARPMAVLGRRSAAGLSGAYPGSGSPRVSRRPTLRSDRCPWREPVQ